MKVNIPYGKKHLEAVIPNEADIIMPPESRAPADSQELIRKALENPIDSDSLSKVAKKKNMNRSDQVAIVVNDITRPSPNRLFIQEIWRELEKAGITEDMVTIVIATGEHKAATSSELVQMFGEDLLAKFKVVSHDSRNNDELVYLGDTDKGLPVYVNKLVAESKMKILTGVIAPHQTAGFSGGRKSVVPGLSGLETVQMHHSPPIRPLEPVFGFAEGNSFHEEAVQGARMLQPDFIVNVVKNYKNEEIYAVAGDMISAHEAGMNYCKDSWGVTVRDDLDVIVVSPGGYPRDIDLHQSQKAMSVAELMLQKKGFIILVTECSNGWGTDFYKPMQKAESIDEIIDNFIKNGTGVNQEHKAFMFARALKQHDVYIVSNTFSEQELKNMFLKKANTIEDAIADIGKILKRSPKLAFVPYANYVLPLVN